MPTPLRKPDVSIEQEFAQETPTVVLATLPPCSIGPAFEIVDLLNDDGTVNSDSKYGEYVQAPLSIAQTDFPSPRGNIDEVDVLEDEVNTYLRFNSALSQLLIRPTGSAFLMDYNNYRRAGWFVLGSSFTLDTLTLTVALDAASRAATAGDVTVTFIGAALTPAQVVAQINQAMGQTVAYVYPASSPIGFYLLSPSWGAGSSLTFRSTGTANVIFGLSTTQETRVEGAGFRGQDDSDGDTTTPWVEFFTGGWYLNGSSAEGTSKQPWAAANTTGAMLAAYNSQGANIPHWASPAAAKFSGTGANVPILAATSSTAGDLCYVDGARLKNAEIVKVEEYRFRLGVLSATKSTFDGNGNPTVRVYDQVEVETLLNVAPLAPRYTWFQAQNLSYSTVPQPALLTSRDATPAISPAILGGALTGTLATNTKTLRIQLTVDGVEQAEQVGTFTRDYIMATESALLISDLNQAFSGVTFSLFASYGDVRLLAQMSDAGSANDKLAIKHTGTANSVFGYTTATPGEVAYGSDPEFGPPVESVYRGTVDLTHALSLKIQPFLAAEVISKSGGGWTAVIAAGGVSQAVLVYNTLAGATPAVGDIVLGGTSNARGVIAGVNVLTSTTGQIILYQFSVGESVTGSSSGATAVVTRSEWTASVHYLSISTRTADFQDAENITGTHASAALIDNSANPEELHQSYGLHWRRWHELPLKITQILQAATATNAGANKETPIAIPYDTLAVATFQVGEKVTITNPATALTGHVLADINTGLAAGEGILLLTSVKFSVAPITGAVITGSDSGTTAAALADVHGDPSAAAGCYLPISAEDDVCNDVADIVTALNVSPFNNYVEFYDASYADRSVLGVRTVSPFAGGQMTLSFLKSVKSTSGTLNTQPVLSVYDSVVETLGTRNVGFPVSAAEVAIYGRGQTDVPLITGAEKNYGGSIVIKDLSTLTVTVDDVDYAYTWNAGGDQTYTTVLALLADLNAPQLLDGTDNPVYGMARFYNAGNTGAGKAFLTISGVSGGFAHSIKFNTSTAPSGSTPHALLGLTPGALSFGLDYASGKRIRFQLNNSPRVYDVMMPSNSLFDIIEAINTEYGRVLSAVGGSTNEALSIQSDLRGVGSKVEILDADPDVSTSWNTDGANYPGAAAAWRFDLTVWEDNYQEAGSGRPNPDAYMDSNGSLNVNAEILRNPVDSHPYWPASAEHYIAYRGLRQDVTPAAQDPSLITLTSPDELTDVLGPISTRNPLGLAMYFQMTAAPGIYNSCIGVDAVSTAEPEGTQQAYQRALDFLKSKKVYGLAVLTYDPVVHQLLSSHVAACSTKERKAFRIGFFCPRMPTHYTPTLVGSGTSGETQSGQTNVFVMDNNPAAGVVAKGIDPLQPLDVADGVYLEIVIVNPSGESEVRRYSVSALNGVVAALRVAFTGSENVDGFYSVTPLTESLSSTAWSAYVRGAELLLPGTTRPDLLKKAETAGAIAEGYKTRRMYMVFPDQLKSNVSGTEEIIPGYYACAALVGLVGQKAPQLGFTNIPVPGFTGVIGSSGVFEDDQLDIIAGGGVMILVQESAGAPISVRHQLSTDVTTINRRELSITKVLDWMSFFQYPAMKAVIGPNNISDKFLDNLSMIAQGQLALAEEGSVILGGRITSIEQSTTQADKILIKEALEVGIPGNYIELTISV